MNYPNMFNSGLYGANSGYIPPIQNNNLPTPNNMQMPTQNNLNWVQGESGARAWIVAPNNTILLMDSESQRFFIKSADNAGMPSMRVFEYTEIGNQAPVNNAINAEYATKQDIAELNARIDALGSFEAPKIEKKRGRVSNDESAE